MAQQIQLRNGTAAEWAAANPILALGEMGVENDTGRYKIGNGATAWNSRAYGTGLIWKGAWSSATAYSVNDIVSYNGSTYISILAGTNQNPSTATSYWSTMALAGTNGNTILSGAGAPSAGTGANGDFYIDTTNTVLYGPKAAGAWPGSGVSLKGSVTGSTGATDNAILRADGTGGATLQASPATISDLGVIAGATMLDTVYAITDGASVDINPANGNIQTWTLGANRTPTATSFASGQSVILAITAGANSATWTTIGVTWTKQGGGGSAPTLSSSVRSFIVLFKIGTTVYGSYLGDA